MKVLITDKAKADLDHIGDYIALDNPRHAITFVSELIDACRRLAEMPRAYPFVPRYEATDVRRRPFGNFLIFDRNGEDQIDVIHILNGAQNYETTMFPENDPLSMRSCARLLASRQGDAYFMYLAACLLPHTDYRLPYAVALPFFVCNWAVSATAGLCWSQATCAPGESGERIIR